MVDVTLPNHFRVKPPMPGGAQLLTGSLPLTLDSVLNWKCANNTQDMEDHKEQMSWDTQVVAGTNALQSGSRNMSVVAPLPHDLEFLNMVTLHWQGQQDPWHWVLRKAEGPIFWDDHL
jgi:hypothetical protein|uniref:Uncharacterized protein n=1 Tax=Eutreptiella gymnastica TaxID=73025 RepID=A0A7S4D1C4_9EUGL|mmetsp:Transcript_30439/g.51411  ORF Transcript_30439/g.51411 Transcript_30439/m.51411 type:complete len:118 (+) Transcript_30439:29-382(+)